VVGAGGTWHQWADTGVLTLHVPSRPGLPPPSRGRAHAHFPLPHRSEARCPLGPLLFGLFIDGLEKRLNAMEGDAPPMLGLLAIHLLLYADDLTFMSHILAGLQKQLDVL
jgi:hypothetical protein